MTRPDGKKKTDRGPGRPRKMAGDEVSFTVRVRSETSKVLEHFAIDHSKSKNDVVREILEEWSRRTETERYVRWVRSGAANSPRGS